MQRLTAQQQPGPPQAQEKDKAEADSESDDTSDSDSSERLSTLPSRNTIARHASRASRASRRSTGSQSAIQYEENPYDIDRVHTRDSIISGNGQGIGVQKD